MRFSKTEIRNYLDNRCSPHQAAVVLAFLQTVKGKRLLDEIIEEEIEQSNDSISEELKSGSHHKQNMLSEIMQTPVHRKGTSWEPVLGKVLVGLVMVVALGIIYMRWAGQPSSEAPLQAKTIIKSNAAGLKTLFQLPDGTRVKLNSLSTLRYPANLGQGKEREVFLEGEAFFEVASDTARPFSVVTNKISTTAIGTSFNIQSFPQTDDIYISLTSGKVMVKHNDDASRSVILRPGEEVHYDKLQDIMDIGEFNLFERISWKENIIIFKNADLNEVKEVLERWYGVEITIANQVQPISFTGEFENQTLENVMASIAFAAKLDFKIEGKMVMVSN